MTKYLMSTICWWITCWWLVSPSALAQPRPAKKQAARPHARQAPSPLLAPTYWKQRQFRIPYLVQHQGKLIDRIAKVQLLLSRTGANDWATLEEAEPNVKGFSYYAPEDGGYWFAVRHLDRRGQAWPNDVIHPQMRIVVDTQQPELTVEASFDTNGEIVIRYEARDANLRAESLIVEVRAPDNEWAAVRLGEPDLAHPNRLVGRARWNPPPGVGKVELRAAIADLAGHRVQTHAEASTRAMLPSQDGPALGSPVTAAAPKPKLIGTSTAKRALELTNPFLAPQAPKPMVSDSHAGLPNLPSQDWPTTNELPASNDARKHDRASQYSPPPSNPYTVANRERTPTQLLAQGGAEAPTRSVTAGGLQTLKITPLGPENPPPLVGNKTWSSPPKAAVKSQDLWSAPTSPADQSERVVNSRTFDIEYDLQSIGPWGVSKVELWGTPDNGQSWRSFGVDPDNRTPVRVTVPGAGTFGFRILVDGANSAGATPPQPGDEPELTISVDLQPPTAKLRGIQLGTGNLADHLVVNWSAADTNLEPRPVALFYSSYPNGPWSTIASGLENTGSYTWRIERHVPGRFYLRLEARDTAGNLATYQSSSPVELARPQPTGRLRGVRPITGN